MKKPALYILAVFWFLTACSTGSKGSNPSLDAQLKVTGANSQLKAKIALKNTTDKEITVGDLNSKYFVVQTATDGKTVETKSGAGKAAAPVKIKPGATEEVTFMLQDNYSFWDRLTKYKISYQGPELKTEPVQVWF